MRGLEPPSIRSQGYLGANRLLSTEANGEKERTFVNLTNGNLIFGHFSCYVTFIGGLTHISIGSFAILLSKNMMEFSDHIGHL